MQKLPGQLPPLLLVHLLCLLSMTAAQCLYEGRVVRAGELLPYPQDSCFNRVCRCEAWDRCQLEVERKVVLVKVNETRRAKSKRSTDKPNSRVKTLECRCVEDLEGSHEMSFYCVAKREPGRSVEARLVGCQDMNGSLRLPNEKVTIQTSRMETMQCDCNSSGHYVNCVGLDDLRTGCRGADGKRVGLGEAYQRTISLGSRSLSLQCTCTNSDQETACRLLD